MSIENLGGIGALAKVATGSRQVVTIRHETVAPKVYDGTIQALFNPSELRYTREVTWDIDPVSGQTLIAASPRVEFHGSRPQSLTVDLFFDTYEGPPQLTAGGELAQAVAAATAIAPFAPGVPSAVDVTQYTSQVSALAKVASELHRPPRCQLWWGRFCLIRGVLTSLTEQYNFFLADGTPVRAVLTCTFTEAIDAEDRALIPELHSADVPKRRVVAHGDTLSSIAHQEYNDASLWRNIARANRIDNPRNLTPGMTLLIPSLPAGGQS